MAILGVQFVISMIVTLLVQKLSPVYSLARWIMCRNLYRYLHPTNEKLKSLAGKPHLVNNSSKGKKRRDVSKSYGDARSIEPELSARETFTIPCSMDIDLEYVPVQEVDIYTQYKYQDFKWLIDFSSYAFLVYILIDLAGSLRPRVFTDEFSIGFVWCFMAVCFALRDLVSLTAAYWRSADSGERSMTLTFGVFFLVVAMGVLVVDESVLDFGLEKGYANFSATLLDVYKVLDFKTDEAPSIWSLKIMLAVISACLGALHCFPGIRYANIHLDFLLYLEGRPFLLYFCQALFLGPLGLLVLWVSPLSKDLLLCDSETAACYNQMRLSEAAFNQLRICAVPVYCALRLVMTRRFLQTYLNSASQKVEKLKKERGRMTNVELQRKVAGVFCYLSAAALQYVAPLLLLLFLSLMLRSLTCTMGAGSSFPMARGDSASAGQNATQAAADYVKAIRTLFSAELSFGIISYLSWWVILVNFVTSCFGVVYLKYLA